MTDEPPVPDCAEHGTLRHVCVHEAATAVMAQDLGTNYTGLTVPDLPTWLARQRDQSAMSFPASLDILIATPTVWVPSSPPDTLMFVLVGVTAEQTFLGHVLADSPLGYMNLWLRGMGASESPTVESIGELAGTPLNEVTAQTQDWVRMNSARINGVAGVLAVSERDPLRLTAGEVMRIARATQPVDDKPAIS